jgi:deazaflavin-dependent oxidoreductase (nitroreductase family)
VRRPPHRLQNGLTTFHRAVLHASGWRLGERIGGLEVLLLTTRGRRSGRARTIPLMYVDDGGYVVVGSNGGAPRHPGWVLNLAAQPEATIELRGGRVAVRAEEITDEAEHARLWKRITAAVPRYGVYADRTARRIPLLRLVPGDTVQTAAPAE